MTTAPARRTRTGSAISSLSLIVGLCLVIAAQFVLLPLLFTMFVHDPFGTQNGNQQQEPFLSMNDNRVGGTPPFQTRKKQYSNTNLSPDATFNGVPVALTTRRNPASQAHCVGENYRDDAWKYRSCRFHLLCFNTTARDFQVYQSYEERVLSVYMARRKHMHASTTLLRFGANTTQSVSIGGLNQKWNKDGMQRLKWFPKIYHLQNHSQQDITYYELPSDAVLIPFHSFNGANPGHLVWDDLLPIYTLLHMFQLQDKELILMRYVLQDGERGLWASCDLRPEKTLECQTMMKKFMPLMLGREARYQFTSTTDFALFPTGGTPPASDLVCAKNGLAGMGALTDHGTVKSHGWEEADYEMTHNHGRGGLLYDFRNFMVANLGLSPYTNLPTRSAKTPHRIVFSQKSSDIFIRNLDFERQLELARESFPSASVENYTLKTLSLQDQIALASQTSVFVTLCGGGAVTAMFLPRGASVILYFGEDAGTENSKLSGKPALLDWDLFNSMSHLRVHWLPRNSRGKTVDETALVLLIQHELDIIESRAFD